MLKLHLMKTPPCNSIASFLRVKFDPTWSRKIKHGETEVTEVHGVF